jgi:nitrogen-specific signal transduction histidine kinase
MPMAIRRLEFAVNNRGLGVVGSKLFSLFNPFGQADVTATRCFGGTGLGVTIVRSLALRMHGDVGFRSRMGEGSRFWFTVRCSSVVRRTLARSVVPKFETAATANIDPVAAGSGNFVLVVDNKVINCMVAQNILLRLGVQVRRV